MRDSDWPALAGAAWLGEPAAPAVKAALDAKVRALLDETGAPAIGAAIGGPGAGLWWRTVGLARVEPAAGADDDTLFWWASVGKAYTASLVQALVADGKLSLMDTIDRWWPEFPEARYITIDHLLTHTSGIRSFNSGEFEAVLPSARYHTPDAIIEAVRATRSSFCPGAYWGYSNTGYVMLGRILERQSGASYADLLRTRIFTPLGLGHSAALSNEGDTAHVVTGHVGREPSTGPLLATPFAAAGVLARADDVVRYWRASLEGDLIGLAAEKGAFDRLYPMFDRASETYGRGVMVLDFVDARGRARRWLAHVGGTVDHNAVVAYDPLLRVYVAVAINSQVSAVAAAHALLVAWDDATHTTGP